MQLVTELVEDPMEPAPAVEVLEVSVLPEVVVEPIIEVTEAEAASEVAVSKESIVEETVVEALQDAPVVSFPVIAEEVDVAEVRSTRFVDDACAHSIRLCSSHPKHQHRHRGFLHTRSTRKGPAPSTRLSRPQPTWMLRRLGCFPNLSWRLRFLAVRPSLL